MARETTSILRRIVRVLAIVAIVLLVAGLVLPSGVFNYDYWDRKHPLENAVGLRDVHGGVITLARAVAFRPIGVTRRAQVSEQELDRALEILCHQGVVITQDFGDGRAALEVEPKFVNGCGTRTGFGRWAGMYLRCPLSELLVHLGYADPDLTQRDVPAATLRRFQAMLRWREPISDPRKLTATSNGVDYSGMDYLLIDLDSAVDRTLEAAAD